MRDLHASISALFQARRFLLPASISCSVLHSPRGEVGEPPPALRPTVVELGWRYRRPQDLSMLMDPLKNLGLPNLVQGHRARYSFCKSEEVRDRVLAAQCLISILVDDGMVLACGRVLPFGCESRCQRLPACVCLSSGWGWLVIPDTCAATGRVRARSNRPHG